MIKVGDIVRVLEGADVWDGIESGDYVKIIKTKEIDGDLHFYITEGAFLYRYEFKKVIQSKLTKCLLEGIIKN